VADVVLALVLAEVCEMAHQVLGKRPFDVQVVIRSLFDGEVAEMGTGEGKSLTAAIGAATLALSGRRVHVMTVNDYLAGRDAESFGPLFEALGLSIGAITDTTPLDGRNNIYRRDVVFSAAKNILFDYLRDKTGPEAGDLHGLPRKLLKLCRGAGAGRAAIPQGLDAVIVDEADSVLIDQAATPFILSAGEAALGGLDSPTLQRMLDMSQACKGRDYIRSEALRRVTLTEAGRDFGRAAATAEGLTQVAPVREHLAAQAGRCICWNATAIHPW
jgi:preprotein translocase subunit SecA